MASYEDEHFSIEPASDADMLRHLLDAKCVSQAELHRQSSISKSSISEDLSGKKPLSRQMIRKLADYFGVDTSLLAANFLLLARIFHGFGHRGSALVGEILQSAVAARQKGL